jgi:hypothetical protein
MSTNNTEPENFFEGLQINAQRFEDNNDDLEAILEGDIGFHAYFTSGGPDPTRGAITAIFQGIFEVIEEVSVDEELVEIHQGEVTPESVRKEVMSQIDEHGYLGEQFRDAIANSVEERVRRNLEAAENNSEEDK